MSSTLKKGKHAAAGWVLSAIVATHLLGCASKSYVVLLPNDDGTIGKVLVTGREGATLLERRHEGAAIGGAAGKTFVVPEDRIARDFGAALAASPKKPLSFHLYFEFGSSRLTVESQADVPKILDELMRRPAPDISVIGHTDTVGDADGNALLGLARARLVADVLGKSKLGTDRVTVETHGETDLLVRTPDNTDEPRNRRVEVTVR